MQDKKSALDNLRQMRDDLKNCTSKKEDFKLPEKIEKEDFKLPEKIEKDLNLSPLEKEDFKLPEKIEGKLHLDSLEENEMNKIR